MNTSQNPKRQTCDKLPSSSSSLDSSLVQVQSCVFVFSRYSSVRALAAAGAYLGMSSVILRMKSDFSAQPLQDSPHSSRIFFRSFTLSFFRSTVVRSSCLSTTETGKKTQNDDWVPRIFQSQHPQHLNDSSVTFLLIKWSEVPGRCTDFCTLFIWNDYGLGRCTIWL